MEGFRAVYGPEGENPADYLYIFNKADFKSETEVLVKQYRTTITDEDSDIMEVTDILLFLIKTALEVMEPDPKTAEHLLYTIRYYTKELKEHYNNDYAMGVLNEKARQLNIKEFPP